MKLVFRLKSEDGKKGGTVPLIKPNNLLSSSPKHSVERAFY